ncbi:MAG: alpha/beta hydrolase-fold protein [Ignavibacteriaceae bacterium]
MKNILLILGLFALSFYSNAQSENIVIGKIDTINSSILNEKRPIWIHKPDNVIDNSDTPKQYPVVYLLDGDWHFVSVVGMLQQLSYINGNTICPAMIVVGIPVKDRFRDLTPTCDSLISVTSGGYNNFISFIDKELIPYIDSTYQTAPYKILIGHSLGGLTVMNTIIKSPEMFNAYVAIDPSMWWDNQISLKEAKISLSEKRFENKRLFLAIANNMNRGMDTISVRTDNTRNTLSIRSILELSDNLNSNTDNKLNYQTKYYINEKHSSIPLIATYDALHFIFDFYNFPIDKSDYADTTMALGYRIENHYNVVSEKMGYKIYPSESIINTLGYNAIYMNNLALSEYFFKMNIKNYPDSYNAYDSLGDYYLAINDKEQAINMFEKSLSIFENPDTRKKLESIKN